MPARGKLLPPKVVAPLVVTLAVTASAVTLAVAAVTAATAPGFSFAGSVPGGRILLVGPALLCLAAAAFRCWRHPDRWRPGTLAAAVAAAWALGEWDNPEAGSALVFSVGLACYAAAPAVVLHAAFGGVRGRLPGRAEQLVVVLGYAVTVGLQGLAVAVLSDPSADGCSGCPDNLWNGGGSSTSLESVELAAVRAGLAWSLLAVLVVLAALLRAGPARLRADGPRWLAGGTFLALAVASYAHSLGRGFVGADAVDRRLWVGQAVALGFLGAAMVGELLRERRSEAALARLVVDLSGTTSEGSLQRALAMRLGDPGLRLAFPSGRDGEYVDERARPYAPDPAADGVATELWYVGRHLATLFHRRGVLGSQESVDDLVATIHLGLEHQRLQAEALVQVEELRASGLRLVETADAERRRLERDLHDGAQQRLVGLALGLRLAQSRIEPSRALTEATDELNRAIDDLRGLARGLSPVLLAEAGLGPALRGLAESCELHLLSLPTGRFPPVVESTVYALVERAACKGPVDVDIRRDGPDLVVEITSRTGVPDLEQIGDRVTTLGGEVQVSGAAVRVRLPT